jgi:phytoene synthase
LLDHADQLYRRADAGIANLDPAFRPAIQAARRLYAEIGTQLLARGLDSVSHRSRVSAVRKAWLVGQVLAFPAGRKPVSPAGPPLSEARFLVEAVVAETQRLDVSPADRRRALKDDAIWLIDLFAKLEARSRIYPQLPSSSGSASKA